MGYFKQSLAVVAISTIFTLQGCAFAPKTPDPEHKHAALERWNRCVKRFESNSVHYCEGHRRDVLANYPAHMEAQLDALLRQKTRSDKARSILKTGVAHSPGMKPAAP